MTQVVRLHDEEIERIQRWRRRVVRLWLGTMIVALATWAAAMAFRLPATLEIGLGLAIVVLGAWAGWETRRGACPRCGARIRFEPRVELPGACPRCNASFLPASSAREC